jgi:hypothetical protein
MTQCRDRFEELVHGQEIVLDEDVASLKRMSERSRIERYNELKTEEEEFQWQFSRECPEFLTDSEADRVRSKFRLARLLIASSFYDDGSVPAAMAEDFVTAELQAVVDFERYKQFDALSEQQIEEKIHRMEGEVYELVTEYTSTQIADVDELLENPDVQQDVMRRLLSRYEQRREKVRQGFFRYVEAHGLEHMVESIETAVSAVVEASDERQRVREELRSGADDRSGTASERVRRQQQKLESELESLETQVLSGTLDPDAFVADLDELDARTGDVVGTQEEALTELDQQIDRTAGLEGRIETKIEHLQQARERALAADREPARQEAAALVENELSKLREERTELQDEIRRLKGEREEIEAARDRLERRQETLETRVEAVETSVETDTTGIEGEAAVTATVARLLEMDYLGRFDITMTEANEIEMGDAAFEPPADYWDGRSERRSSRARLGRLLDSGENPNRYPTNGAARYEITESRYLGLSRDTRMIIEAQVYSHLEAYATNEFDARPADLDDLLSVVNEAVYEAESEDLTYLLGVASPTGWTDRVRQQIQDEEFARTRFSQHVSLCLIDLQAGAVVYDESDLVAAENASLFEPPVDAERIRGCVETIRTEYVDAPLEQTVLLRDVAAEHDYDSHVVKRAFNRLEHDGVGEQFFVDDLGLTLEVGE